MFHMVRDFRGDDPQTEVMPVNEGKEGVVFGVENVCMRRLVRRSRRGFVSVRRQAVLCPFAPVGMRGVRSMGGRTVVSLSCVGTGRWFRRRRPGDRLCGGVAARGDQAEMMNRLCWRTDGEGSVREKRRALHGLGEAASVGHTEGMWYYGFPWGRKAGEQGRWPAMDEAGSGKAHVGSMLALSGWRWETLGHVCGMAYS
jgi:hypothetical protein